MDPVEAATAYREWTARLAVGKDPAHALAVESPATQDMLKLIIGALQLLMPEFSFKTPETPHGYRPLQDRGTGFCTLFEVKHHGSAKSYAYWFFSTKRDGQHVLKFMRAQ